MAKPVDTVLDTSGELNHLWSESERGSRVTVKRRPIFDRRAKIFTMGSCFAVEIKNALKRLGFDVYPKYGCMKADPTRFSASALPEKDNINHYDTFTIRQEFERALSGQHYQLADFWNFPRGQYRWTDPYRKRVFGVDEQSIQEVSNQLGDCIAAGIREADVLIITLGLIECWRNKANGLYVCTGPKRSDDRISAHVEPHLSSFAENYENLRQMLDGVRSVYPDKSVVFSVSPVALARTFSGEDVVTANMMSKSTLRAVAGQLSRERPELVYWPSYEFAMAADIFQDDGRHVRPEAVKQIVSAFLEAHQIT